MVENPYIGRIVVLLTPVFAGVAAWLVAWIAENLPGSPVVDGSELTALSVAGALAAGGAVIQWLNNRGKYEQGQELIAEVQAQEQGPVTNEPGVPK